MTDDRAGGDGLTHLAQRVLAQDPRVGWRWQAACRADDVDVLLTHDRQAATCRLCLLWAQPGVAPGEAR